MERLTKRENGHAHYPRCFEKPCGGMGCRTEDCEFKVEICERLAAYEDTGLTPGEVKSMQEEHFSGLEMAKLHSALMELKKYQEADKDGRLVVLPSDKALTNADRMRAATNQQLAKLLYDNQKEFCRLMYKNLGFEDELEFSEDYSDILEWLNKPQKAENTVEVKKDG
nr:MAG TPA: hypothetical protein [Caudoviricetes sp.]